MRGLNETVMEAQPLLSLPMGPVRTLGDNRVGWIPNCEDAAPPRCAPVCKTDVLRVLRVPVFQFCTCLWRHVLGVLGVLCVLLGVCVLCALCALYAFSKPYVQHRWPQKRASGQKYIDGRQRNMRTHNGCYMVYCCTTV